MAVSLVLRDMQENPEIPNSASSPVGSAGQQPSPHSAAHKDAGSPKEKHKPKKRGMYTAPPGYPWGVKTWLTRLEIGYEYSMCPRTIRNLEKRGLLVGSKISRHCIYKRCDVEACLEAGK